MAMLRRLSWLVALVSNVFAAGLVSAEVTPADQEEGPADVSAWLTLAAADEPAAGRHVVLVSGDEEYRSEEALTQLAKILALRHGFRCTVLYAVDPATGCIDPTVVDHIPGLELLRDADLMVIATRFRRLPDPQMAEVDAYLRSGRPVVGLRTATHAFNLPEGSLFHHYSWNQHGERMPEGFGRQVLGETWIAHHGRHGSESTRGLVAPGADGHPILRGIADGDVWGPTDVYAVRLPLPGDSRVLLVGQVLAGMSPGSPPVAGPQNDPPMPLAWTKSYSVDGGPTGRVFTTTLGAAEDLLAAGTRRLLVNACYWAVGLEDGIPPAANVNLVGAFEPTPVKAGGHRPGVKPHQLR